MPNIVQYIPYKGEKWPVRISYYALKKFQEETKREITDIDKDISLLEVLLWYSFIAGHMAESKPMIIKKEEMEFVLDESMNEFNEILVKSFPLPSDKNKKK